MVVFNVFLTSMPVISLGVFEQDVSSDVCLQVMNKQQNLRFSINKREGKLLIHRHFLSNETVSIPLQTRAEEHNFFLEPCCWLDSEWHCCCFRHIPSKRIHILSCCIQTRRTRSRHHTVWCHYVHVYNLDCKLPNCSHHHSLHLDPASFHLGQHPVMVHFRTRLRCAPSRLLSTRI